MSNRKSRSRRRAPSKTADPAVAAPKRPQRPWLLPVVLAVAIVAAGGGAAAYLYWQNQLAAQQSADDGTCGGPGNPCPPPPPLLAIGVAIPHPVGPDHWYNASVQSASGGIELKNTSFRFLGEGGSQIGAGASWSLTVENGSSAPVGVYSFASSTWTSGGTSEFSPGDTVALYSGTTALDGDSMLVTVANAPEVSVTLA